MDDYCGSPEDSWFYTPPNFFESNSSDWTSSDAEGDAHAGPGLRFLRFLKRFAENYQPIHGYLCVCLCTFGLLTNVFNFVVLTRPNMRTSINMILAAIALCDTGTMSTYFIYVTHFYVSNSGTHCSTYTYGWMNFILFHSLWSILLHSSSIWLVVLLALMRLAVMRRVKFSQVFLKPENVWKLMLYVYAPLGVLCVPVIFTHSVKELPSEVVPGCVDSSAKWNDSVKWNDSSKLDDSTVEWEQWRGSVGSGVYTVIPSIAALRNDCLLLRAVLWINGVCFKLLPCLLLALSIWGLLRTLHEAKERNDRVLRRRSDAEKSKYFNSRTNKMLLAILFIFLVTELPQALVATLSGLNPHDIYFKIYPVVGDLLDLLSLLNSGVNFILYCAMSSRFRSTFFELFAPKLLRLALRRRRRGFSVSDNDVVCGVTVTAVGIVVPSRAEILRRTSSPAAYGTSTSLNTATKDFCPASSNRQKIKEVEMRNLTPAPNPIAKRRSTMLTLLSCDSPTAAACPRPTSNLIDSNVNETVDFF